MVTGIYSDATVLVVGRLTNANATIRVDLSVWLRDVQTQTNPNAYSHVHNGHWTTVDGGQVVRLEEQSVP
jgi:hypothetical protein